MVPFRVLKRKKYERLRVVFELLPLGAEKISSHAYKTGSWYLLVVLIKISDEPRPRLFDMGVPWGVKVLPRDRRKIRIVANAFKFLWDLCRKSCR